jgi:prolyl 4-hydroxylase
MKPILLSDYIKVYDNVISSTFCDDIKTAFELDEEHHIKSKIGKKGKDKGIRDAIEMNCTLRAAVSHKWYNIMQILNKHAASSFHLYCSDLVKNGYPEELLFDEVTLEQWRMHRYDPGKHYYKQHIDAIDIHTSKRMLVMLYYINTVDEGGETCFDTIDVKVKPQEGRLAITPAWFGFPHSAETPVSNTKYMIKTYLHYPGAA